jgi:hypothetical protein
MGRMLPSVAADFEPSASPAIWSETGCSRASLDLAYLHFSAQWRILADLLCFYFMRFHSQTHKYFIIIDADGGGFEPPVPFGTHALQACTINRSVTHPSVGFDILQHRQYSREPAVVTKATRGRGRTPKAARKSKQDVLEILHECFGVRGVFAPLFQMHVTRIVIAGTIRRAAIECRCKTRRSRRILRSRDQNAFCKRSP